MAVILNIETSTDVCSVALSRDGEILEHFENYDGNRHSTLLGVYTKDVMQYVQSRELRVDAIAVSIGPGSYTGLRIGLAQAKGMAFGMNVPLIGVNTLQLLVVSAMFNNFIEEDDVKYVPMIDARRMEVYTAVYTPALKAEMLPQPLVLSEESFIEELRAGKLVFCGNGTQKAKAVINSENAIWIDGVKPVALDMVALSEKAFREHDFLDIAYCTPLYLKEFQAIKPKKLF